MGEALGFLSMKDSLPYKLNLKMVNVHSFYNTKLKRNIVNVSILLFMTESIVGDSKCRDMAEKAIFLTH